ncbi:MAG: ribose-phosphate pyrophosphokinase [Flavobacteriales bacterium]|nr:ribose-phosphate pyrophosphokinase [Flavobacteriales bacterium]
MQESAKVFSGTATRYLAEQIAARSGERLGEVSVNRFSDGEFQPSFEETVRGELVFIVQSTFPPSDNLFELLLMVDAARRASAKRIVAVIPYFGFARQDRKDKPRVSIGAKLVANMLTAAGVDRVMTMDLHADQIQGFFEVPVDHLFASSIFLPYIQERAIPDLVIAAPDTGGTKRANAYAKHLGADMAICYKQRKVANQVDSMTVIGDVKERNVVLVDDMVDTAGTLTKAADMMADLGARSVTAMCTHAVLSGEACKRINDSALSQLIVTDTIPISDEKRAQTNKIKQQTVAGLFADVIKRVRSHESISSHFIIA